VTGIQRFLTGLLFCLCSVTFCGCAQLEAWKSNSSFNHKTGEAATELKGASEGGKYIENKGLNLSLGDNTATIVIVGLIVLGLVGGYAAYNSIPHKAIKNAKNEKA
jgi:hypothetical protein